MRRLLMAGSGLAVAVVVFAASALPAFGEGSGTVNAQVTVASPCITLETTNVNFGTLAFNTPSSNHFSQTPTLHATNCSGTEETVLVRGTDATGPGATWTLYETNENPCSVGPNRYQVQYQNHDDPASVTGFNIGNSNQVAGSGIADGAQHAFRLTLLMPCTGSDGAGTTMSFGVIFTATF